LRGTTASAGWSGSATIKNLPKKGSQLALLITSKAVIKAEEKPVKTHPVFDLLIVELQQPCLVIFRKSVQPETALAIGFGLVVDVQQKFGW
jgi:hypothetical protein